MFTYGYRWVTCSGYPLTHTDPDVAAGHPADAGPDIHTGRIEQYLCIFMIIGIIGYFCHHGFLVDHSGRRCGKTFGQKANGAGKMVETIAAAVGSTVGGTVVRRIKKMF